MEKSYVEKLFIIGGSTGSLEVLLKVLPQLQPLLSSSIIIILHRKESDESMLTDLLQTRTDIFVKEANEKETIEKGNIYIAPANYHLLIENDQSFSLDVSEKINYSRPSIDVSFETAAEAFGNKVVAILLSGANADGAQSLKTVKRFKGTTIVQNPVTATVPFMPQQAIDQQSADYIFTPDEIAAYINLHR